MEASELLKKAFRVTKKGTKKKDGSLVSEVDFSSEQIIISAIKNHFPKDGFLSEEAGEIPGGSGWRWIIDPLDGTHNFLAGIPIFGCLIGLEKNEKIILGACSFPALGEFLMAEKGKGAFSDGEKIHVSQQTALMGGIFLSDGKVKQIKNKILADAKNFTTAGCRLRMFGSTPFSFCRIAVGQGLIATNRLGRPWDIAAPALLIEESGGRVTDQYGEPWSIYSNELLATNGLVHAKAFQLFRKTNA